MEGNHELGPDTAEHSDSTDPAQGEPLQSDYLKPCTVYMSSFQSHIYSLLYLCHCFIPVASGLLAQPADLPPPLDACMSAHTYQPSQQNWSYLQHKQHSNGKHVPEFNTEAGQMCMGEKGGIKSIQHHLASMSMITALLLEEVSHILCPLSLAPFLEFE